MNILTIAFKKLLMTGMAIKSRSSLWLWMATDPTHCGPAHRYYTSSKFA